MSAAYRALLAEGDRYLEEAQGHLGLNSGTKQPAMASAHAAVAAAFYARAALEKPDPMAALLAKAAAARPPAPPAPDSAAGPDPVAASMDRHPAGKKRPLRQDAGDAGDAK